MVFKLAKLLLQFPMLSRHVLWLYPHVDRLQQIINSRHSTMSTEERHKAAGIVGGGVLIGIYIDQNYEVPRVNRQSWDNLMKKMDDLKRDSKKDQS